MPTFTVTTPAAVRDALRARAEIAIVDVRQEGPFADGHPLFAASFPLGRLEALAYERLPRPADSWCRRPTGSPRSGAP